MKRQRLKYLLREIPLKLSEPVEALSHITAKYLGIPHDVLHDFRIIRESLDARKTHTLCFRYTVEFQAEDFFAERLLAKGATLVEPCVNTYKKPREPISRALRGRPIVVGLGPCGLFAAYTLACAGLKPLVIERGQAMPRRELDFAALRAGDSLNPESNVCFGEGGAGAFSDGKLTTRSKDPRAAKVLALLTKFGAPPEICYQAKPHLGTELVREIVTRMRVHIQELGAEILFGAKLCGLDISNGMLNGIRYRSQDGEVSVDTNCVVLAIGHSARDTYEMLLNKGIQMQPKPFAIGVRVEHPRALIDERQLGKWAGHPRLGAADYKLAAQCEGRGVYSFCMCPGGEVICSATEPGATAVNGMSLLARNGAFSNSAIVASVSPADYPPGILGGILLQRQCEQAAFAQAEGYGAPIQLIKDFVADQTSVKTKTTTYLPYTLPGNLRTCLPKAVGISLAQGFSRFEKMLPGFMTGVAIGVETRTSAPVRILRNERLFSQSAEGLYPAGEGAGYAGGIVSAAVDGLKIAEEILFGL